MLLLEVTVAELIFIWDRRRSLGYGNVQESF